MKFVFSLLIIISRTHYFPINLYRLQFTPIFKLNPQVLLHHHLYINNLITFEYTVNSASVKFK